MQPVILSGGSGTRLWPLSRSHYPKQFLPLVSQYTMLQDTALRLVGLSDLAPPIAVCNEEHRFMLAEQLWEIGIKPAKILLEPIGRNTAPAVALAALAAARSDEVLLVLPADHVIANVKEFQRCVEQARRLAATGALVTFGIVPTAPETGYGYIRRGAPHGEAAFHVAAFVEKPDRDTAQRYLDTGDHYWNSGMFAFRADVFLAELARFQPTMLAACQEALAKAVVDQDFTRLDRESFLTCPADSIDYAVMEKTDKALVIPLDAGWNDVGSWSALWAVTPQDSDGNALRGDVMTRDVKHSFISSSGKLIAVIGVEQLVIIESDDAIMIAHQDRVQEVKQIVEQLKQQKRTEAEYHRKVYRPWGHYDLIDQGERHKTKRIVVKPGAKLSLQMHHHRAEHWIVVKGTALVTRGEEKILLSENQSTYIPLGTMHCLENPGLIPLEMVEVQSGSYLGEDDIVRYHDHYGRT